MATTKVIKCKCEHRFQDKEYGPGMRLHNRSGKKENNHFVCTVCLDKKTYAREDGKETKGA